MDYYMYSTQNALKGNVVYLQLFYIYRNEMVAANLHFEYLTVRSH